MTDVFSTQAILDAIAEYADEGDTLEDIQDKAFYIDPWIIGTYKAAKALEQFNEDDQLYEETDLNGVFGAIQYVNDYQKDACGEVCTKLENPEFVATMVACINGQIVISELADKLDIQLDYELTKQQAEKLSSVKAMQELLNQ